MHISMLLNHDNEFFTLMHIARIMYDAHIYDPGPCSLCLYKSMMWQILSCMEGTVFSVGALAGVLNFCI